MLRIGEDGSRVSREDIIIEGAGFRVTAPIYAQANPQPSTLDQVMKLPSANRIQNIIINTVLVLVLVLDDTQGGFTCNIVLR